MSDHCALHYRLVFEETSINEKPEKEGILGEVYQTFYWDQNSTKHFRQGMQRCEKELKDWLEMPETEAENIASSFTNIIQKIAQSGGIEKKRLSKSKTGDNPNWFDSDCRDAKTELRELGKLVKHKSNDSGLRATFREKKGKFKKLTRKKKKEYVENTIKGMSLSKKQGKAFWKYLDKLGNKQTTSYVKNISPGRWQKYFKNILRDEQEVTYLQDCHEKGPLDSEITSKELHDASYEYVSPQLLLILDKILSDTWRNAGRKGRSSTGYLRKSTI